MNPIPPAAIPAWPLCFFTVPQELSSSWKLADLWVRGLCSGFVQQQEADRGLCCCCGLEPRLPSKPRALGLVWHQAKSLKAHRLLQGGLGRVWRRGGEALQQAAQAGSGGLLTGGVQGQVL